MNSKKQEYKEKKFDVFEHFSEWEGWTCNYCGKLLESSEKTLIYHLEKEHKKRFKKD